LAVSMCILMISAKYEEIYPPAMSSFAKYANCTPKQFLKLEAIILQTINWNLMTSTCADIMGRFFSAVKSSKKTYYLTKFILESSWRTNLEEGNNRSILAKLLNRRQSKDRKTFVLQTTKPSYIALGSIVLSLAYQGKICYPISLEFTGGVEAAALTHIVKRLHEQFKIVTERHLSCNSAVVLKYSTKRYCHAGAFIPPSFRDLLEHNGFRDTEFCKIYNHMLRVSSE